MSDHTENNLSAFIYAHKVLEFCESKSIPASVTMFLDGSGVLNTNLSKLNNEVMIKLENILKSNRWSTDLNTNITLTSCLGWVDTPL